MKRNRLPHWFMMLSMFVLALFFWNQPTVLAAKYSVPPNHQLNEYEHKVIELVNKEREKKSLQPLQIYQDLSYVARIKSSDMRDNDYYGHTSPKYGSPYEMMKDHGIEYKHAGENIYAGPKTPEEAMKGWMESEGHRNNILSKNFSHIGVGYVEGGSHGTYWTQMFISK